MQTVVLAGGFGTRLQTVLKGLPKPLAPVGEQCFLSYTLNQLKKNGLNEFIFCLYYEAEKIKAFFNDGSGFGVKISYSIEDKPLETAGAIGLLRDRLKEAFCVINADTYLELDVRDCILMHKNSNAITTIAVFYVQDAGRYGKITINNKGLVIGFSEKKKDLMESGLINAGFYVFEPQIFDFIPENKPASLEREVFPAMLKSGRNIKGYRKVSNFYDIGIPSGYDRFREWIIKKHRLDLCRERQNGG